VARWIGFNIQKRRGLLDKELHSKGLWVQTTKGLGLPQNVLIHDSVREGKLPENAHQHFRIIGEFLPFNGWHCMRHAWD
jgi:hypothetical protein